MCYWESAKRFRFDVVIPGSEVPNWFKQQSVRASINLEVPSNLFKQFRGVALCAVFGPHWHCPPNHLGYRAHIVCLFKATGYNFNVHPCLSFSEEFDMVESDHRWFMYLLPNFFKFDFPKEYLQIADGSNRQLEIEFKPKSNPDDPEYPKGMEMKNMIEIKKCGAHMVYEEEMENLKESMGQSECNNSIIPYNKGVDHFEEDIKSKRSRDDKNGASGEGSSTPIPHPRTKRERPSDDE